MKTLVLCTALLFSFQAWSQCFSPQATNIALAKDINTLVKSHIKTFKIPNAVILVGTSNGISFHKAFGVNGKKENTVKTVYDLASLTKLFTATAIMQLVEQNRLSLKTKLEDLFITVDTEGEKINIEHLLRHSSGYQAGLLDNQFGKTPEHTWQNVLQLKPIKKIGTYLYSDINYLLLGKIVEEISGLPLNHYVERNILNVLSMNSTGFNPLFKRNLDCKKRCAQTGTHGKGIVHDPTSRHFKGVIGSAGLFATAEDISKFATAFLNQGEFCGKRLLDSKTVKAMTLKKSKSMRGLGFDITSPYSNRPRGDYFSKGISFGHTGFTGTSLWIDPDLDTYLIILTNTVGAKDEKYAKKGFLNLIRALANTVGQNASEANDLHAF
jgi:CubicO group peptidase (beta-lactamase class C family)